MLSRSLSPFVPVLASAVLLTAAPDSPARPRPGATASVTVERGKATVEVRSPDEVCVTRFPFKTADDVPRLLRLVPPRARLRFVSSRFDSKVPPELFAALLPAHPEIETLVLMSDRVTDKDMVHLAGLKRLRLLVLGTPRVTAEGMAVLSGLRELTEVDFLGGITPLTDDGLKGLRGLTRMRKLSLTQTRVRGPGLAHLGGMIWLDELGLGWTPLRTLKELPHLPALTRISLDRTGLRDEDLPHLARCPRLRRVVLDRTRLTGKTLDTLARLEHLEELVLTDSPVTDAGVARLAGAPKLRNLRLGGTQLTDGCFPHLARLKALEAVSLNKTRVTEAGVVGFSREHPRVFVVVGINGHAFRAGKRWISPEEREEQRALRRGERYGP
jgi:hypothetical protein